MQFPKRPNEHDLEDESERYFTSKLPRGWTVERIRQDYGIDLHIDIFENNEAAGLELIVQLKGATDADGGATEGVRINTSTYNFLRNRLQVAMVVKYVAAEAEAYWILLRDVPPPDQQNATLTIRIPRANRLSNAPWDQIAGIVREVTDRKLAAQRAHTLRHNER
jgi:hypothetical protein